MNWKELAVGYETKKVALRIHFKEKVRWCFWRGETKQEISQ